MVEWLSGLLWFLRQLLVPPRMLAKWPFQQLLDGWLKCWAQMLGQQQQLARCGQIKVPIFYDILYISETAKHFASEHVLSMSKVPWVRTVFCVYWLAMLLQALSMLSNSSSVCEARKDATQRRKTCQRLCSMSRSTISSIICVNVLYTFTSFCISPKTVICGILLLERVQWKSFQLHSVILI